MIDESLKLKAMASSRRLRDHGAQRVAKIRSHVSCALVSFAFVTSSFGLFEQVIARRAIAAGCGDQAMRVALELSAPEFMAIPILVGSAAWLGLHAYEKICRRRHAAKLRRALSAL